MDERVKNQYADTMARPRAFDERQVLERAREQFWATGFAGTRMDDIAQATGLGKGSLYGAFGDKGKLFHRVFGDWCTAVVEVAEGRLAGGSDAEALARLSGYVHLMAENTASDRYPPAAAWCNPATRVRTRAKASSDSKAAADRSASAGSTAANTAAR